MTPEARKVLETFEKASGMKFADLDAPGADEVLAMFDALGRQGPPGSYVPLALRSQRERQQARQSADAMLAALNTEAPGILASWLAQAHARGLL